MSVEMETCPASAPFFGFMGVTSALVFANIGAAYGTAKSGVGISSMGVMNPGLVMRNIIPVVMAGVLGIYGLIVAVIIQGSIVAPQNGLSQYSLHWLCALGSRSLLWFEWLGRWHGYWNCWRCWRACCWTTGEAVRRYDFDSDFRRGSWPLRIDCCVDSFPKLLRL